MSLGSSRTSVSVQVWPVFAIALLHSLLALFRSRESRLLSISSLASNSLTARVIASPRAAGLHQPYLWGEAG